MIEKKACEMCRREINVKRFPFVNVNGLMQRDTACKVCRRNSKHCPMCKKDLPKSSFGVDKSRPDGKAGRCMDCNRAYHASRRRSCSSCGELMPPGVRATRCESCEEERMRDKIRLQSHGIEPYVMRWFMRPRPELTQ